MRLTERELQVLGLVAQGLDNKQVGAQLYITPNTVKTTLARIGRKLGNGDRTYCAVWALRRELIPWPETSLSEG